MKKLLFSITFIFFFLPHSAQIKIEGENLKIEVKKAHTNSKYMIHFKSYYIKPGLGNKKIQVRIKLETTSKKKEIIDPNKFYLVIESHKIRIRPVNMKYPFAFVSYAFEKLSKEESEPIPDSFYDYKIEGFKDYECPLNYGTEENPNYNTVYFKPNDMKNTLLDIYFLIPDNVLNATFYYGITKISDIKVK